MELHRMYYDNLFWLFDILSMVSSHYSEKGWVTLVIFVIISYFQL